MTRRIASWLAVALLVWLVPTKLPGWGRDGHAIIAALAEAHLTEGARLGIKALLKDESLASISSWADEVRPQRDETYNWHFVDIPASAPAFDEQRDCYRPNDNHAGAQTDHHNCVVDRIGMFKQTLMNPSASDTDRMEALKFIVHFVADVHQPFHAIGEAKGGNGIRISEFGSSQCGEHPCNLHAAWDRGLIAHTNLSQPEYVQHLEEFISQHHLTAGGQPEDWANESHKYAQAAWLNDGEQVDENYYKSQIKVVDTELALAGLRLAALLNDAFGRQTAPAPPKKNPFVLSHGSATQDPSASGDDFGLGTGAHGRQMGGLEILSDTQGVNFGPYVARILTDVRKNWYRLIPKSAEMENGKLAIEFAITKDGKVAGMKLAESSGDVALDRAAWGGITASNPFHPLPSEFGGRYIALRFRFYYNPGPGTLTQGSPEVNPLTSAPPDPAQAVPGLEASTTVPSPPFAASPDPVDEAKVLFRKGHFDAALQKYQELLQRHPKSPDAYAGMIRVYLKMKNVQQAYGAATKSLEVADAAPVRVALGEVYFRQGKIREAEQEWVNVINSGHQEARAYLGLARVRWAISMYKSGRTMIEKAHELDTTDPDIQKLWVSRLSRAEHIKYLEDYLAGETNDDAETISNTRHYLEYLKALDKQPKRNCRLVGNATATEVELVRLLRDAVHVRGYGLSVAVNGAKSKLLLDTGASGILINRRLAEKANVIRLADTDIRGIGDKGNRGGYTALANSLKIGQLEFQDCPLTVLEQRSVVDQDGLIGADVFGRFLVDIDFPNEKLRLTELPKRPDETAKAITLQTDKDEPETNEEENDKDDAASSGAPKPAPPVHSGPQDRYVAPQMKSYSQVYRFGHALLVPTRIGDAPGKLFLLDTGSFSNLITPDAASEVTKIHGDSRTVVKGISGSVKDVYRADKAVIQFGHLRQENQDLPAFDLKSTSERISTEVSGILGFTLLHLLDIKIDYRDGLVDFEYNPRR